MSAGEPVREARCQCGQLCVTCRGEPVRVSVCHCLNCQQRSGAPFAMQARFPEDKVELSGADKVWVRNGEDGGHADFHFCPDCGSTVWYRLHSQADLIAVAVGAFADPAFPSPQYSVWEERKHPWVSIDAPGIEHFD